MRARRVAIVVVLAGCTDGATANPGLDAILRVADAQYRPGPLPSPDADGPAGIQLLPRLAVTTIGELRSTARAGFDISATSAVIAVDGVDGAWIVPAGAPDVDFPGRPAVRFTFGVIDLVPGPFTLLAAGVDAEGRFGAPLSTEIVAAELPPPTGELVIGLSWSGPADLDLHVVDALGGEAWSDKPNTMIPPAPGTPIDPNSTEHLKHGQLDHDGNRDCTQHAHPNEHVIWQMPPPSGEYIVRVDTRSLCGAPSAVWYIDVYRPTAGGGTELLGSARGTSTPADTQHGLGKLGLGRAGLGVTALRFSL